MWTVLRVIQEEKVHLERKDCRVQQVFRGLLDILDPEESKVLMASGG